MADQDIRYRAGLDATDFEKGATRVAGASNKMTKGVKGQSRSLVQLSYALDDAQYGFRGVQNNLQQLAVTAGLGGPLILGITALTIALNYLIENWDTLTTSTTKATKALDDYYKKQAEGNKTEEQRLLEARIKETDKEIKALQIRERYYSSANYKGDRKKLSESDAFRLKTLLRQNELDKAQISAIQNKAKVTEILAGNAKKTTEEYQKQLKAVKDSEDIAPFSVAVPEGDSPYSKDNVFKLFGINPNNPVIVDPNDVLVLDESELDLFGGKFESEVVAQSDEIGKKMGEALQSALTNSLTELGQSIGEILVGDGDFGEKFLGIIGSFMQAFGSAIIGIGVAQLALETGLASFNPALVIGAGVALVAAGSVLGSLASKGPDGKEQPGASRSIATGSTTTPSSVQGLGGPGGLVATVRGQDLRFLLQGANETYNARN